VEILTVLKDTPIPTILVVGGIFFLALSIVTQIGGKIKVSRKRQNTSIAIGAVLLVIGIALYLIPAPGNGPGASDAPTILGVTIRQTHEGDQLVIYQEVNFYDEDGNTNAVEWELIDLSDPSQREYIDIHNGVVDAPPELQKIRAQVTGTWYCEGHSYVATLAVTLVDLEGNRSEPVRYTVDCNGR